MEKPHSCKLGLVTSDGHLSPQIIEAVEEIARNEGIHPSGITILGGKPYINVVGLDAKIRNRCEKENLVYAGAEFIPQNTEKSFGGVGKVSLFDRAGFLEALSKIGSSATENIIARLTEAFTYIYSDVGYASAESVKMSSLKNEDFLRMMASRRATNRAKRAATGCGLTSIDEMMFEEAEAKAVAPVTEQIETKHPPEQPVEYGKKTLEIVEKQALSALRRQLFATWHKKAKEANLKYGDVAPYDRQECDNGIRRLLHDAFGITSTQSLSSVHLRGLIQFIEERDFCYSLGSLIEGDEIIVMADIRKRFPYLVYIPEEGHEKKQGEM